MSQSSRDASPKDFDQIAVERGYVTAAQVAEARRKTQGDVGEYLAKIGLMTPEQVRAVQRAVRNATVIAGFEILEKVGQGGMGAVFRARQIGMDRVVALKILPPKLAADTAFKDRFLREARLSAKLNHLNIINGIDCGEEAGYTYFAMEFVEGKTSRELMVKDRPLTVEKAYKIVRQIAEALVYAHRNGLVHRDIKPENIMVTPQGIAKLCDLGLAKQEESADDASLTQSGQAVGTPHYISPEQARGEKHVDTRSDIYALGASFYHMLAGHTPFNGNSAASIMALHLTDEAPSVCELNEQVPEAFGAIVSKMMAKEPADRYQTPEELIADLEAAHAGDPVAATAFRGKTSCAMPRRGGKRSVHAAGTPVSRTTRSEKRGTTGKLAPIGPGDRTTRHTTAIGSRPNDSRSSGGLMIAAGAAAAALLIGVMLFSGGSSRRPARETRRADPVLEVPAKPAVNAPAPRTAEAPKKPAEAALHKDPAPGPIEPQTVQPTAEGEARQAWEAIKQLPEADAAGRDAKTARIEEFLKQFGDTIAAAEARRTLEQLQQPTQATPLAGGRTVLDAKFSKDQTGKFHPDGGATVSAMGVGGRMALRVSSAKGGVFGVYHPLEQPEDRSAIDLRVMWAETVKELTIQFVCSGPDGQPIRYVWPITLSSQKKWMDVHCKVADARPAFDKSAPPIRGLLIRHFEVKARSDQPAFFGVDDVLVRHGVSGAGIAAAEATPPAPAQATGASAGEAAHAAFLAELLPMLAGADLTKARSEAARLAADPRFAAAGPALRAEIDGLGEAIALEAEALQKLGQKKGERVRIASHGRRKAMDHAQGKVAGLDPMRGLDLTFAGGGNWFLAHELEPDQIAGLADGATGARYLILRGELAKALAMAGGIEDEGQRRSLAHRFELLESYRAELAARRDFAELERTARNQKGAILEASITTFEESHGKTMLAQAKKEQLEGWKKAAKEALAAVEAPPAAAKGPFPILFVVGDPENLNESDRAVRERLERQFGGRVEVVDDSASRTGHAQGKALIVISSTTSSREVTTKFRDVPLPVICWEDSLYDDLGMTTDAAHGEVEGKERLQMVNSEHVLAAGLSGTVQVARWGGNMAYGYPSGEAVVIARAEGGDQPVFFAYEANANMIAGKAPARRLGMFMRDDIASAFNENGWRLFDAAVRWCLPAGAGAQAGAGADTAAPAPAQGPFTPEELRKQFSGESRIVSGGVLVSWIGPAAAQAFMQDWRVDDPHERTDRPFARPGDNNEYLIVFSGRSGEIWDGKRSGAVVAVPKIKAQHFRFEIQYSASDRSRDRDGWSAGLGFWNGGDRGLLFGVRRASEGPLTIWGSPYTENRNVDIKNLARDVNYSQGQLAVQSDGRQWTFFHRDFNRTDEDGWRQLHRMDAPEGEFLPAITPWSWGDGSYVRLSIHAARLYVMPSDPLIKK